MNAKKRLVNTLEGALQAARQGDKAIRELVPTAPPVLEPKTRELLGKGDVRGAETFLNDAAAHIQAAIDHGTAEAQKKLQPFLETLATNSLTPQ